MNRDLKWGHINFKLSEDLKDSYMMYINGSVTSKTLTTEGNIISRSCGKCSKSIWRKRFSWSIWR